MESLLPTALLSCAPSWHSSRSLKSYRASLLDPPFSRQFFLDLKLGWLLAHTLNGPIFVYRDCDLDFAETLEQQFPRLQAAVLTAMKGLARAREEPSLRKDARAAMGLAVRRLRLAHTERVTLARGYSHIRERLNGDAFVCLFDGDPLDDGNPNRHRYYEPPRVMRPGEWKYRS
jgi:hypothetical protein